MRLWRVADRRPLLAEVLITKGQIVRAQGDATAAYAALGEALRLALTFGPRLMVAYALERLADMMAARGQTQLGVQYLAAASALREQMGTPVRPVDQASLKNTRTTARSAVGADAFAAVWAEAKELPPTGWGACQLFVRWMPGAREEDSSRMTSVHSS